MKRGQVFVHARMAPLGAWGMVDVFDLDDDSFRSFVLDQLCALGLVAARRADAARGEPVEYSERGAMAPYQNKTRGIALETSDPRPTEGTGHQDSGAG